MASIVSVFVSLRRQNAFAAFLWLLTFAICLAVAGVAGYRQLDSAARGEASGGLADFGRIRGNIVKAFDILDQGPRSASGECTDALHRSLRNVSLIPDGLNEFIYAPNGVAQCSSSARVEASPFVLSAPDVAARGEFLFDVWFARDLGFVGFDRLMGSIFLRAPFAVVVRPQETHPEGPSWLEMQSVLLGDGGRIWSLNGVPGLYASVAAPGRQPFALPLAVDGLACDGDGFHCVAYRADIAGAVYDNALSIAGGFVLCFGLSSFVSRRGKSMLARHFSFEARFLRHLTSESIVCVYQPIVELATGRVTGCEVLARWRDIDDSIVFPDRFIPIVEKHGLTLAFTRLVADKAFEDLSGRIGEGQHVQVNVNIFPRDLDCETLRAVFADFLDHRDRFALVVEIVESDAIDVARAQPQIEALRAIGIRTYIDDFGTGYSNIENLAALSVDGVKLDRSFAMAPDDGIMAKMLGHAVEMIRDAGRTIVIEGVETAERLAALRAMSGSVHSVQGYHLSRPIDAAAFAAFCRQAPAPAAALPKAA